MNERMKLVRGDAPGVLVSLTDEATGDPINIVGATPRLKFREEGTDTVLVTIEGGLLTGRELEDGTIDLAAPYDTAGSGGRCLFNFPVGSLNGLEPGNYEGEVELTLAGGATSTAYEILKFKIRGDF